MTRTEKIIHDFDALGQPSSLIAECRRLARLCDAYWREAEAWRAMIVLNRGIDSELTRAFSATDAARREAGEGQ